MTNPEERKDPWQEALNCYEDFADEVIITGKEWPIEFSWEQIGQYFQEGFDRASSDWVLRMDLDYFFHEKDFQKIKNFLIENKKSPVVSFPQYQIFTPERYQVKTRLCNAFNKKYFPNISLNGGGDLCQPTLNGIQLLHKDFPTINTPLYQYDSILRTKEIIANDRARFARAWYRHFNNYGDRGGSEPEEAFDAWFQMIIHRYKFHVNKLIIEDHPKYIKETLLSLDANQFGYSAFGLKDNIKRNIFHRYVGYKHKYLS